jgi:hypothetical protein
MIDCTAGLTASNKNFAATNGLLRADIEMNGTAHLYENKDTSKKVSLIQTPQKYTSKPFGIIRCGM